MLVRQLISILKYSLITYLNCNILMLRDDNIMKNIKPYKQINYMKESIIENINLNILMVFIIL